MKKNVFVALVLALVMLTTCALAAEYTYDPNNAYVGVMKGEFNNVAIAAGAETRARRATPATPEVNRVFIEGPFD